MKTISSTVTAPSPSQSPTQAIGVAVSVGPMLAEGDALGSIVAEDVGVIVTDDDAVAVGVTETVGEDVAAGVTEAGVENVGMPVGLDIGVDVGVIVAVRVGDLVGDREGVAEAVAEGVCVGLGVSVGRDNRGQKPARNAKVAELDSLVADWPIVLVTPKGAPLPWPPPPAITERVSSGDCAFAAATNVSKKVYSNFLIGRFARNAALATRMLYGQQRQDRFYCPTRKFSRRGAESAE